MSAHEHHSNAAAAAVDEATAAATAHQQAQATEMTAMAAQQLQQAQAQLHFQAQAHTLQLQAQAQQTAMQQQQVQIAGAAAAQAAAAMQQQPTTAKTESKSELTQYYERVDKKAKKAAARSNKKGASDEGAYRLDEFQKIGQAAVRRAEKKEYEDDPKELRRLRRRRGQPDESDSSDSNSSDDSSESSNSDSCSGDSDSDSDGSGRARKRRKKGSKKKGTKKPAEVVEWVRFKKGRARCKGRTKAERRAERLYARTLGGASLFTSTHVEAEARRLHQLRMLVAQMGATTATPAQIVRVASSMLETMSDALLVFDSGLARSADTPSLMRALNETIADAAGRQAPQFGETAARTLRGATAQQQWRQ